MTRKAMLLSFLGGFLSLAVEVIWIRLFTFSTFSIPQAFSLTLAIFLLGIAFGSLIGKKICQQGEANINIIGKIFFISAVFDCLAILAIILVDSQSFMIYGVFIICIFCCALLRGIVFPIVHHLGSENKKTGAAISNVYFANVVGCTISPIFIGFYLLDILTTQQAYLVIVIITLMIAFFCIQKFMLKAASIILILAIFPIILFLPEKMITSLAQKKDIVLENILENKHGFIQVYSNQDNDKIVLGGNVYDGMLNIDLEHNSNGIHRAYFLPIIAPNAKNILVIGLSTGSWARVLTSMPELESITIIELNPGYPQLANIYQEMSDLLKDKRVHIINDDGRRWLNKNPDKKFDFILMNTTFHWRSYASNLLSQEFSELTKRHLTDNGFIYFNTTSSYDAHYTSKSVYPYVYEYSRMSLASLKPIIFPTREEIKSILAQLKWADEKYVFDTAKKLEESTEKMLNFPLVNYEDIDFSILNREPEIIKDGNMITEYRYGALSSKK